MHNQEVTAFNKEEVMLMSFHNQLSVLISRGNNGGCLGLHTVKCCTGRGHNKRNN